MKKMIISLALVMGLLMASTSAFALTSTGPMIVQVNVLATCTVTGVTDITFVNYDPTSATALDAAGDFTFACTTGVAYNYYITGAPRQMTDGTDVLNYELYSDAGRTAVFPSASLGIAGVAADNLPATVNVYGRIPAGQNARDNGPAYVQNVTVTVEY